MSLSDSLSDSRVGVDVSMVCPNVLMQRRAQALQLKPSDPAYGMLRGDGNEDLGSTEIGCGTAHPDGDMGDCQTELPCKFYARFAAVLCPSCPTWGLD